MQSYMHTCADHQLILILMFPRLHARNDYNYRKMTKLHITYIAGQSALNENVMTQHALATCLEEHKVS